MAVFLRAIIMFMSILTVGSSFSSSLGYLVILVLFEAGISSVSLCNYVTSKARECVEFRPLGDAIFASKLSAIV